MIVTCSTLTWLRKRVYLRTEQHSKLGTSYHFYLDTLTTEKGSLHTPRTSSQQRCSQGPLKRAAALSFQDYSWWFGVYRACISLVPATPHTCLHAHIWNILGTSFKASVKNWGELLIATGSAYKPPKCFYHLISFVWDRSGNLDYDQNHEKEEFQLSVSMPDGSMEETDHLPVTESRETLGVWLSPVGCTEGAMTRITTKTREWVARAKEGKLRWRDVWFLMDCQLWLRLNYGSVL
eukprot:scaffold52785_cov48-Cyclotella_meneghiniana.AAC.7